MGVFNPDGGSLPGDPTGPDQATVDQMNAAVGAGYSYNDIASYHADQGLDAPPRPDLGSIMSGQDLSQAQNWTAPTMDDLSQLGRDAINEGAGPIGEAILAAGAGGVGGLVKNAAEGVVAGVLADVSGTADATAVKIGAGVGAGVVGSGIVSLNDPDQWDKDFKSQQDLVLREEANKQNRDLAARRNR